MYPVGWFYSWLTVIYEKAEIIRLLLAAQIAHKRLVNVKVTFTV